jgi:hypothetical protein
MNPGAELILFNIFASTIVHSFPQTGASCARIFSVSKPIGNAQSINQRIDKRQDSSHREKLRFDEYRSPITEVYGWENGS